ncbi:MAG TPA: hypothetical protein DHW64_03080, partial [Chitinophagaceae bacterium]|nr:hypothetical protein [Chitinophagaceae bacterium]
EYSPQRKEETEVTQSFFYLSSYFIQMALTGKKKKIDVIDKLLEACYQHNKDALFVMSLMHQYEERGSLSKKQLEGLLLKAKKVKDIPAGLIAGVEAIVLKMPTRDKTPVEDTRNKQQEPEGKWDELIQELLQKYPQHKRVLFLKAQLEQRKNLSVIEQKEVEKFYQLLILNKK